MRGCMPAAAISLSTPSAAVLAAMPTTKVGKPAAAASRTACMAFMLSATPAVKPLAQLGSPSVARTRYFGLGVITVCRYAVAFFTATAVGVALPVGVVMVMAAARAA